MDEGEVTVLRNFLLFIVLFVGFYSLGMSTNLGGLFLWTTLWSAVVVYLPMLVIGNWDQWLWNYRRPKLTNKAEAIFVLLVVAIVWALCTFQSVRWLSDTTMLVLGKAPIVEGYITKITQTHYVKGPNIDHITVRGVTISGYLPRRYYHVGAMVKVTYLPRTRWMVRIEEGR